MAQNISVIINLHLLLSTLARASRDHSSAVLTKMIATIMTPLSPYSVHCIPE